MKQVLFILGISAWLAGPSLAQSNTIVNIKLKDGTVLEGTLLEEREQEVIVLVAHAGGSITQTETFPRADIVEIIPLSAEELTRRAMQLAYENTRRYTLHPSTSYAENYYGSVIDNVLRPFLEKYPQSPHAEEIAKKLAQWQADQRQVAAGNAKYHGQWMPTAEVGKLMEREKGQELLAQARTFLQRRQYERAIETVRLLPSDEARQLTADAYQKWAAALDAERQSLTAQIDKSRQTAGAASQIVTPKDMARGLSKTTETQDRHIGQASTEQMAATKAAADARSAAQQLGQLEARLQVVDRNLARAMAGARQYGATTPGTAQAGSSQPKGKDFVQDVQAPIQREDFGNPTILRQIGEFFTKYWMPTLLVLLLGVWYFSRKMLN